MPLIENPLGGRSIEEWIGKTPDAKIPLYVKDRVFARYKGRCHISGRKITPRDPWEVEHVRALAFGGEHRESNLAPAIAEEHRKKTAAENSDRAKADRLRRKHDGSWPKSPTPLKGRNTFWKRGHLARAGNGDE